MHPMLPNNSSSGSLFLLLFIYSMTQPTTMSRKLSFFWW